MRRTHMMLLISLNVNWDFDEFWCCVYDGFFHKILFVSFTWPRNHNQCFGFNVQHQSRSTSVHVSQFSPAHFAFLGSPIILLGIKASAALAQNQEIATTRNLPSGFPGFIDGDWWKRLRNTSRKGTNTVGSGGWAKEKSPEKQAKRCFQITGQSLEDGEAN